MWSASTTVRGKVISVSPVEGTFVTDQLEPTKACAIGRSGMNDARIVKGVKSFILRRISSRRMHKIALSLCFLSSIIQSWVAM